jgi:capsular polysaccharide biosynthesis protein
MQTIQHYCNRLVQKFDLPPWLFGYRYLPVDHPEDYTKRVCSKDETKSTFKIVEPETVIKNALPCNIDNADKLNSQRYGNFPLAFSDVPSLEIGPSWTATVYDCFVLRYRDEWNNDFYAVVSSDKRSIAYPGIGYRPEHARQLRLTNKCRNFEKGTWIFGMWYRNYFLWLLTYVSRLMLAMETGCSDEILFPGESALSAYNIRTIERLRIPMKNIMPYDEVVWHVDKLTLVHQDPFRGDRLRKFRGFVSNNTNRSPWRKVFVNREKAQFRRLINQDEVWPIFKRMGWEKVCMEDLSFDDQIKLMSETRAFSGVHGAGFGNIIFCPKGTHVFEVSCYGNASFYALACAMGHHYWLEKAQLAGRNPRQTFDDIVVDPHAVETILHMIEYQLTQ